MIASALKHSKEAMETNAHCQRQNGKGTKGGDGMCELVLARSARVVARYRSRGALGRSSQSSVSKGRTVRVGLVLNTLAIELGCRNSARAWRVED